MTDLCTITFQPGDVRVTDVPRGESILRAALQSSIHINASCGGAGSCGKCRVQVLSGDVESEHAKIMTAGASTAASRNIERKDDIRSQ